METVKNWLTFLSQVGAKTSFIDVHVRDGKLVASHKSDKEVNFQRHYSVKGSYNPAEEPQGVVEVENDDSLANTNSPYARTFTNRKPFLETDWKFWPFEGQILYFEELTFQLI